MLACVVVERTNVAGFLDHPRLRGYGRELLQSIMLDDRGDRIHATATTLGLPQRIIPTNIGSLSFYHFTLDLAEQPGGLRSFD